LAVLDKLLASTPPGILDMLRIKGIGPKKIHTIWKEMGIESLGELLYACRENRLKLYKGFGDKTQQNIIENIEFYFKHMESYLYAQALTFLPSVNALLEKEFGASAIMLTGAMARQLEVIDHLEFAVAAAHETILGKMTASGYKVKTEDKENGILFTHEESINTLLYPCQKETLAPTAVLRACSPEFAAILVKNGPVTEAKSEEDYFKKAGIPFIPAPRRENPSLIRTMNSSSPPPPPIESKDIRGLIHCHSTWSDGGNSLEELAEACREKGLEYMVISDHSKSAFYAQGLSEERIAAQQQQVDELNRKLKPFKIFKSIECDILNDGSLDYNNKVLSSFDLVIASVHSNLKMTREKAMERLLKAIENPYTSILGHMTGRLLLSRNGYPVDHERIIAACADHRVAIELNANPNRLDIDWRFIDQALEAGVYISINPDAHSVEGIDDILFGVLQAQKTTLSPSRNLSSLSLPELETYLEKRKKEKGL
jgi:DNA polymerase (family 10)